MRMPGLNYRLGRLPLFPQKGILFEAINPANMHGLMGIITQKKTQRKPGRTRIIWGASGADTANE